MNRGQLLTEWLSASNWGAFDHASHGPQLLADNYWGDHFSEKFLTRKVMVIVSMRIHPY